MEVLQINFYLGMVGNKGKIAVNDTGFTENASCLCRGCLVFSSVICIMLELHVGHILFTSEILSFELRREQSTVYLLL